MFDRQTPPVPPEISDPADVVLRAALRALPVPQASPDFDTRVLAALRAAAPSRPPWWQTLWQTCHGGLRPVLGSAAFSLVGMLLLLRGTGDAARPAASSQIQASAVTRAGAERRIALDDVLDRPNLSALSLLAQRTVVANPVPPPAGRAPQAGGRRPAPQEDRSHRGSGIAAPGKPRRLPAATGALPLCSPFGRVA
jgi:hypothetical protein